MRPSFAWLLATVASTAAGAPCTPAGKPINELPQAEAVAGEFCRYGQTVGDSRELFRFTPSSSDLQRFWSFKLQALPGEGARLEFFELVPGANAQTIGSAPLRFAVNTSSGSASFETPPLLLRGSSYVLAISGRDGVAHYRVLAKPKDALPSASASAQSPRQDAFGVSMTGADKLTVIPWRVTDASALWTIAMQVPPGVPVPLALRASDGSLVAVAAFADTQGIERAADLSLAAGEYKLEIAAAAGTPIVLSAATEKVDRSLELAAEPDNDVKRAHPLKPLSPAQGRLVPSGSDEDLDSFQFAVDQQQSSRALDITLRSSGPDPVKLQLLDQDGAFLAEDAGKDGGELTGLVLKPGTYYVIVRGRLPLTERYQLELSDSGAYAAGTEMEPNNSAPRATPVASGESLRGTLSPADRVDCVALEVDKSLELWNLELLGDGVDKLRLLNSSNSVVHSATRLRGDSTIRLRRVLLPQGRQVACIDGDHGNWLFRAQSVGPPTAGDEFEPNDSVSQALPLAPEAPMRGWLDHGDDNDRYFFYLPAETRTTIDLDAPAGVPLYGYLQWGEFGDTRATFKTTQGSDGLQHLRWNGILPAGDYFLGLRTDSGEWSLDPYTVRVAPAPYFERGASTSAAGAVDASLELAGKTVAAYLPEAQTVDGVLQIRNGGASKISLVLASWLGDERWQLAGLPRTLDVEPGAVQRVPVSVRVAADARDDWPVGVEVSLKAPDGSLATAAARLTADGRAPPVAAHAESSVPDALRGGVNIAWSALGAKVDAQFASLFDGLNDAKVTQLTFNSPVTVELAGGRPQSIVGVLVTPTLATSPADVLKHFSIAVSEDGTRFNDVLQGDLSPLAREQGFVFPTAVNARFVRLTATSNYSTAPGNRASLSELKIVADPNTPFGQGFDLGRLDLGGHIVWTAPQPNWTVNGVGARWPATRASFLPDRKSTPEIVFGFRANRAAKIVSLVWHDLAEVPPAERVQVLDVGYGDTPLGPWTPLGKWETRNERFELPAPVTMRFLHVTVAAPSQGLVSLPQRIGVIEAQVGAGYRSILGEWGDESRETDLAPPAGPTPSSSQRVTGGRSRAAATALPADTPAQGTVQIGSIEDWYKIELPASARQVTFRVTGSPAPEAAIALETSAGAPVALTADPAAAGAYSANVGPGTYFLRVTQPPRSVIVAWDTSGSIGPFVVGIQRVVEGLSRDLEVGREEIELIPFRGEQSAPLIGKWSGERGEVYSVFEHYPWGDSSSNAEAAIVAANEAFGARQGLHALAIITDAASDGAPLTPTLWSGIARTHPRIFALKVPTADSPADTMAEMNLMEDWAHAMGGYFGFFASQGSADVHFRRMAARLKQPTSYGLSYAVSAKELPPGLLTLTTPAPGSAGGAFGSAVEILIDASGSMLQRIAGQTKIDIEKALLTDLTSHGIPPGTPLAIRVFGQGGKDSCRTDLVQSLGPLDPKKLGPVIAGIRSTNGAKTAIADSLRLVVADLGKATGERMLVLVTDGEETCGGDPSREIQALGDAGLKVVVNIVGFSVDTAVARSQFQQWATLGGGQYFDANDRASLDAALHSALLPAVDLFTPGGERAGHVTLGAPPLKLAAGRYVVRRADHEARELGTVEISSGATTTFELR